LDVASATPPAEADAPPGRLVDLGTHRLHLFCLGQGSTTVVLEAGFGGFSLEWKAVQEKLATQYRVCTYDRAGYGWSDPGPAPRTAAKLTEELHELLIRAQEPAPYVLVGHSFGGFVVQLFAKHYPALTAGMVLVDSSHPAQFERFPRAYRELYERAGRRYASRGSGVSSLPANYPPSERELALKMMQQPKTLRALRLEYRSFPNSGREVIDAGAMPVVPAVVLTRTEREWPHTVDGDVMEALWPDLQRELAEGIPRARHFTVASSGHHIHLDKPGAIEEAVHLIIEESECLASANAGLHDSGRAGAC
jgi:pimeloyl-ACP methyl ester carboxylesterase